jgi:DNA-binding transcriptional LysR family regulator
MQKCMAENRNRLHHVGTMKKETPPDIPFIKTNLVLEDWNLLRSFIAIYETGTLTEAATRLNTTQPSMGRHLRELEAQVKETLFVRLPGKLKPNARADALFEAILPMRHSIREAENLFANTAATVSGVVRVAVSEAYAYHVIPAILLPLLDLHPELEIELSVSNQTDNLLRREADIAVRFFRPSQDDLIAIKVGDTSLGLYAHEDYLKRHGEVTELELGAGHIVSGNDREPIPSSGIFHGAPPKQPVRFRFRSDFVLVREASAMAGHTISMMFVDIAKTKPQLKRVLADRINHQQEVWLCAHEELRRSPRMRLVWERLEVSLRNRLST